MSEEQNSATSIHCPIRRVDRALSEEEAYEIVRRTHEASVGVADTDGTPYVFAVNTALIDGAIYFHCAHDAGRKEAIFKVNPKVALLFIGRKEIAPTEFSTNYASASVYGHLSMVTDPDDKRDIMLKFTEITAPEAGAENTKVYYENAKDAIANTRKFFDSIGIPNTLGALGIDDTHFGEMADHIQARWGDLGKAFVPMDRDAILTVLRMSL